FSSAIAILIVIFAFVLDSKQLLESAKLGLASIDGKMDSAVLNISNALNVNLSVWYQTADCYDCPLLFTRLVSPMSSSLLDVQTNFMSQLMVSYVNTTGINRTICSKDFRFHESGSYELNIGPSNNSDLGPDPLSPLCALVTRSDGPDFLIPLYICLSVILLFFLLRAAFYTIREYDFWRRMQAGSQVEYVAQQDLGSVDANINQSDSLAIHSQYQRASGQGSQQQQQPQSSQSAHSGGRRPGRLRCLDTFRGLCLVVMVFVNYGGGGYWFFQHSTWNGLTVADLVFPWFVFIMGTAIGYTLRRSLRRGASKRDAFLSVCRRSALLFALGVCLTSRNVPLDQLRIPGVLQRLAVAYFCVATVEIALVRAGQPEPQPCRIVEEQGQLLGHWAIFLTMPVAHTLLSLFLPVPGCPTGYLGPGGIQANGSRFNCTGGAAGYIDRLVFGDWHMYRNPTCRRTYLTYVPYDPEGLLGCLTSTFMCYLGFVAGRIFAHFKGADYRAIVVRLCFWGIVTGSIAAGLSGLSRDTGAIPINKNLWSLSFILALSGLAFILLAALFLINDYPRLAEPLWSGSPFHYPGTNSILVYVGHELLEYYLPITWLPPSSWQPAGTHAFLLPMHLWGACFWTLVAWILHRNKIFFSV
ncbi:hypothetical protein BOX15_Mlig028904g1, partial [Macrostomum lignano]